MKIFVLIDEKHWLRPWQHEMDRSQKSNHKSQKVAGEVGLQFKKHCSSIHGFCVFTR